MPEQRRRNTEIFAEHFGRRVLEPIGDQEGVVLVKISVVEYQKEFTTVRTETLDGMRNAGGEIPQISDTNVINEIPPLRIDCRDARAAIKHVGPFRSFVPVQFAHGSGIQPHIHARDIL